jgi:CPA1 family monovalent cation:H+ antiporter
VDLARFQAIPLFGDLPRAELEQLAAVAHETEIEPGQPLAVEGDFGHCLFAIESGTADVVTGVETIRSVGPGDVVGEIAVLSSGRRTASLVATSPMRVITVFKRDVWALERHAPEVARRLRELVAEHQAPTSA